MLSIGDRQAPASELVRTIRVMAVLLAVAVLVWALAHEVMLVFLAVLLGVLLQGASEWVARRAHLRAGWALAVCSLVMVAIVAGCGWWIGPRLIGEGRDLWNQVLGPGGAFNAVIQHLTGGKGVGSLLPGDTGLVQRAPRLLGATLSDLIEALVVAVGAIYIAAAPGMYVNGLVRLVPIQRRARARAILAAIASTLRWWTMGQLVDMVVVGVLATVGLRLLGLPLAFALGVLAGLLTFVPYFGAIVAAVPALIVALTINLNTLLWVVGVFLVCHGVEGYIVGPYVQHRTVELPPALTIFAMLILGALFGPLGLVVATPLTAVLLVAVREVYVVDTLGDAEASETGGLPASS